MWDVKYQCKFLKDIIDNTNQIIEIDNWLFKWTNNNSIKKALLIAGLPGIGKTTTARLVAKKYKYIIFEKNASDLRNKAMLTKFLKNAINNEVIRSTVEKVKKIIIMDEIDGMFSDIGGISTLCDFIKTTKVPIICICNDSYNQKVKTLSNYCKIVKFNKPRIEVVFNKIKVICQKENLILDRNSLMGIIEKSNQDIRQILIYLQQLKLTKNFKITNSNKLISFSIYDTVNLLLQKKNTIKYKRKLFFDNYELVPRFIHENYLEANRNKKISETKKICNSLCMSNIVENKMRKNMNFSHLNSVAFFSTYYTTQKPSNIKRINFPLCFTKLKNKNKINEQIKNIKVKFVDNMPFYSNSILKNFIIPNIFKLIIGFLKNNDFIKIIDMIKYYNIDLDDIKKEFNEVIFNPKKHDHLKDIPKNTKLRLTKEFNKIFGKKTVNKKK